MRAGLVALCLITGCGPVPDPRGLTAWLRVEGGQFVDSAFAAPEGGPAVMGILDEQPAVRRGEAGHVIAGSIAPGGTAVSLALDGDRGWWIVRAGVPDITAPDQPTFRALFSISPSVPLGPRALSIRAADGAGRYGPPVIDSLVVGETAPPAGALVVSLAWDTEADLDLHVVAPGGFEIWSRSARDPATGGTLDHDSNATCVIDGARAENVVWRSAPPTGSYAVRVDTPSLCGAVAARWTLSVRANDRLIGQARGESTGVATRGSHDRGAGLTVLTFEMP